MSHHHENITALRTSLWSLRRRCHLIPSFSSFPLHPRHPYPSKMDDSTSVDFVDVSLIGSPDRFQVAVKHLWRTGQPHSDDEKEDTETLADDSKSRHGSPQWLPRPSKGFRRLKPLTVDTNLCPPFLVSPGHPSTTGSAPSPSSYTPDYFDICGESLLPPLKVDDDMGFHHYPHLSIYVREIPLMNSITNLPPQSLTGSRGFRRGVRVGRPLPFSCILGIRRRLRCVGAFR